MAQLLQDIEWDTPVLPAHSMPDWEAEAKAVLGVVPDILKRAAPNPWLRSAMLQAMAYRPSLCTTQMLDICALVTAQENACRYCYGVARSQMLLLGYSEEMISAIERDRQLAELDERSLAFVQFCRALSRASPRPGRAACARLEGMGYSRTAVAEMAFLIGNQCFLNRVSTFVGAPPERFLERLPKSLLGRLFRPLIARKMSRSGGATPEPLEGEPESFAVVVQALVGLGAARLLHEALEGCFASDILSREAKVLMFAVVARSLECSVCESESRAMGRMLGFADEEFDHALRTLSSPRLDPQEQRLLGWTRETVHYQTGPIQRHLKELVDQLDRNMVLEAIGVAALANSTVRLAALLD